MTDRVLGGCFNSNVSGSAPKGAGLTLGESVKLKNLMLRWKKSRDWMDKNFGKGEPQKEAEHWKLEDEMEALWRDYRPRFSEENEKQFDMTRLFGGQQESSLRSEDIVPARRPEEDTSPVIRPQTKPVQTNLF